LSNTLRNSAPFEPAGKWLEESLLLDRQQLSLQRLATAAKFYQNCPHAFPMEVRILRALEGSLDRISPQTISSQRSGNLKSRSALPGFRGSSQRALLARAHCGAGKRSRQARALLSKARRTFSLLLLWRARPRPPSTDQVRWAARSRSLAEKEFRDQTARRSKELMPSDNLRAQRSRLCRTAD